MKFIDIKCTSNSVEIFKDNKYLFQNVSKVIKDNKVLKLEEIVIKNNSVYYKYSSSTTIIDIYSELSPNSINIKRKWDIKEKGNYKFISYFSYDDENLINDVMIPGIWYKGNVQGSGSFPSKLDCNIFSFCETRMAVPGCIQMSNGKRNFTTCISPTKTKEHLSSVSYDRHGIRYVIPSHEWPKSYKGKKLLVDTLDDNSSTLNIIKPSIIEKDFIINIDRENDIFLSYKNFIKDINLIKKNDDKNTYYDFDMYSTRKFTRLLNMIRKSDDNLAYIIMGEENEELQEHYDFTAGSFLVKSIEAAYLLTKEKEFINIESEEYKIARLNLAKRFNLDNDENLLIVISQLIGDFFLNFEVKKGVHQDCYDIRKKIFGGYLGIGEHNEYKMFINSRCNGETMLNYLKLYKSLKALNIEKKEYLELPKRVASFYCDKQLQSGSFGRWWSLDGKPIDINGTNGVHVAVFLIELLKYLDPSDFLYEDVNTAIYKAYDYYNKLTYDEQFYGDTLDADSFDKEAGVVLLKFFLDLYEKEKEECYLKSSQKVANFLLTWIWQCNSFIDKNSPLGKRAFKTKGMTSVSVAHNHLDFYGIFISYDFYRLFKYTNIEIYKEEAKMMSQACLQLISNPYDRLGRSAHFDGWQPEQINHTNWDYFNNEVRANGGFYIDIAWVTVLGLSAYLDLKNEFIEKV